MTAIKEYVLRCDYGGCPDWIRCVESTGYGAPPVPSPTLAEARKWARRKGWRTVKVPLFDGQRTDDRCPRHKP